MIRKTVLAAVAAATVSAAAMGATATSANAGVSLSFGFHGYGVPTVYHAPYYAPVYRYRRSCRYWLNKYNWTGRWKYYRKYKRCLRRRWY